MSLNVFQKVENEKKLPNKILSLIYPKDSPEKGRKKTGATNPRQL